MTFDNLKHVISEISKLPLNEIQEHSSFKEDLEIDSLQMVNLVIEIQTRFGIDISKIQSNDDLVSVGSMFTAFTRE
ncbi:phosphopantetheine-binding protein [Domibacillus sp. PGB-M46]|uniref:acyl carrier protein n=1 Tax=Domibacillus sp. PGB-M46 TaxID=2910255 RepID=UPI001F57FAB4|nr:phosphopantetheine-binding protein [Domibacillus sp. PGB-M46]MCI2256048.1 phosphopantetheine-binding protein [Domibacillus sp. PGB-M46]